MERRVILGMLLAFLVVSVLSSAISIRHVAAIDPPSIEWSKAFGGAEDECAYSVIQTGDGGYALFGHTRSYGRGGADFWLVKTFANGTEDWSNSYGGSNDEYGRRVVQTSDGGYVIAGWIDPGVTGDPDFWLIKTSANGVMDWSQRYDEGGVDYVRCLIQTTDGGFAIAGWTDSGGFSDFTLVKTDSRGNQTWMRHYGGRFNDCAYSVVQTSDGGYALAGYTESYGAGNADFWLVKTDSLGHKVWDHCYGGTELDCAYSLVQTNDGGYTLAGETRSHISGKVEAWLVRTDSVGNMLWSQSYGMPVDIQIFAYSLVETPDGGYAMAGHTWNAIIGDLYYGCSDAWLAKTDADGNMQWSGTYGGTGHNFVYSMVQTSDGGYALAGRTDSINAGTYDFWLVKAGGTSPDFSIIAYPASLAIQRGSTGASIVTIASLGNFSQQVGLSASGAPSSGISASLSPQEVTLPAVGAASATLTINVSALAAAGYHPVTVSATSGTLNRSVTTVLIVLCSSRPWDLSGSVVWVPDQKCDIKDLALVARLYASRSGDGRYDGRADLTGPAYLVPDGEIDNRDVALVADHFGETYL